MTERPPDYTPDALGLLLAELEAIDRRRPDVVRALITAMLSNVQATAAATTVAGYDTVRRTLDRLVATEGESRAAYEAVLVALEAVHADVRAVRGELSGLRGEFDHLGDDLHLRINGMKQDFAALRERLP